LGSAVTTRDNNDRHLQAHRMGTLQQRFEESSAGRGVVSAFIVVFLLVGIAWNVPDSPIRRLFLPVVTPVAAPVGLDQYWGMYGTPDSRIESVDVHVHMATGEDRVWTMQPGARGVGWWDRWILLRRSVIHDASIRPQLAGWVVRELTAPGERAVGVTVVFRTETLSPPGKGPPGKPATKVLFQEVLATPQ
jgi:hypothetical protein